ncbi:MAG: TIGR03118 family protein, partial [Alphaproteobacteria bacterium]|nr:TIGR03118 family protein [Alphaproteobacteria bacterium]
ASDGGIISAWTERKKADGTFDRADKAIAVVDESKQGAQFFGLAIDSKSSRIYAADFGAKPEIKVYDGNFKRTSTVFDMPFDDNKNGKVDAGEYAPFNVQNLKTPAGDDRIFVAYAKTQACPKAEIKAGACKKGEIFAGEEDTSKPGYGRVAEFTEDGKLVRVIADGGKLSAPWGLAFAPDNFGALSGTLLVSNFGDGTIAAYDDRSYAFRDMLRDNAGKPVAIEGIWGLLFGNGASLGDTNALYFAAGPHDENDGIFGSLRTIDAK